MRTQGLGITDKNIEAIQVFQINNLTANNASLKIPEKNSQNVITETWEQQEVRDFAYADARGWSSLISTNSVGEKRYYHKEGAKWVQKNSEAEATEKYVVPPTLEQLAKLRNLCILGSEELNASMCGNSKFMDAYNTNDSFRYLMNKVIDKYYDKFLEQSQNRKKIVAEQKTLDCLMEPTPEKLRGELDYSTQNYLRQLRCGTITESDKTNYELSRINSSLDELKYRLDTKITFPPLLLDPIPTLKQKTSWEIRWEGDGVGSVIYSNGESYRFHCENSGCKSY